MLSSLASPSKILCYFFNYVYYITPEVACQELFLARHKKTLRFGRVKKGGFLIDGGLYAFVLTHLYCNYCLRAYKTYDFTLLLYSVLGVAITLLKVSQLCYFP
jgi:hypothetical protein